MRTLTLDTIQRRIDALKLQAEKVRQREKIPALRNIVSLMRTHEISVGELRAALKNGARSIGRAARKTRKSLKGMKVPPMYRNPKTGETWSGRGKPARWLTAAEKAGHKRTEFLVKKD